MKLIEIKKDVWVNIDLVQQIFINKNMELVIFLGDKNHVIIDIYTPEQIRVIIGFINNMTLHYKNDSFVITYEEIQECLNEQGLLEIEHE